MNQSPINDHLRLISIFHYVVGGLHCLCFSFPLIHFFIGLALTISPPEVKQGSEPFPTFLGPFFMVIGGTIVLLGWTLGGLTILSGKRIAQRRSRTFSIVMAAINCLSMPFGTILGIFTIILLTKPEAVAQYEAAQRSTVISQP
jgi:hypothetical protein